MRNLFVRSGIALLILALAGFMTGAPTGIIAQDATPETTAGLPEGPLGERIQWLVDYLNLPEDEAAAVDLTTVFTPAVLADVPADQLQAILSEYRAAYAPVSVDSSAIATSMDAPPTVANFTLIAANGTQIPTSLSVDPASGMISSLWFSAPLAPAPTQEASATVAPTETATALPTETATAVPPTETSTSVPTETPTEVPTETPTEAPTETVVVAATDVVSPIASPAEGSPAASPEAVESADAALFPDNALGQQAAWTWSLLTNGGVAVDASEIEAHVAPSLLAVASADQIATGLVQLQEMYGPFTLDPNSMIMTANELPTNMRYSIVGANGETFNVSLKIDPETELLTGFLVSPGAPAATPEAADLPDGLTDTQVSFTSGEDTIYGSIMAPASFSTSESSPAALIISGSGATDRDGVSSGLPLGTNRNLAITLAEAGIPSLRYDKLGSGQTGLGSHADPSSVDYQLFLQEASDAAAYLAEQPGVDPSRLIIVGHSEGALFALALADELTKAGTPPAGLILVAPLSVRYLDLITDQMTTQLKAAVDGGSMTEADATALADELEAIVESLRTTGELPESIGSPQLAALFNPESTAFLSQIDQIDPGALAAGLPSDIPVLVLLGAKDAQITGDQVRHLLDGFKEAGNSSVTFVALPKADHSLRIIDGEANPAVDYANPDLEFSPDAVAAIDAFLVKYGLELGA